MSAATCTSCGQPLTAGNTFCGTCGARVAPPQSAVPPTLPNMRVPTLIVAVVAVLVLVWPLSRWVMARDGDENQASAQALSAGDSAGGPVKVSSSTEAGPASCANDSAGFKVKVPHSWAAATPDSASCTRFVVALGDTGDDALLQITPDVGTFDDSGVQGDVISERKGNVSGRPATVYEANFTEAGASYRAYGYILKLGDRAFSVGLVTAGVPIPSETKKTFDEVVRQIVFSD